MKNTTSKNRYNNKLSFFNKLARFIWMVVNFVFFKPLIFNFLNPIRILILKCFGAKLHKKSIVYSNVKIWAPWNLIMQENSCLAPEVDCYNVDKVIIGSNVTVSQKSYLCTASHDITKSLNPLITAPIIIENQVWVAADTFIGMGVTIKQGSVVGARAAVFKDVESWTVVGGNPARFIKKEN